MDSSAKEPSVCFKVEKIIGVSVGTGNIRTYQVQWAPAWVSGLHLVGCEHLIEEFLHGQTENNEYEIKYRPVTADGNKGSDAMHVHYPPYVATPSAQEWKKLDTTNVCNLLANLGSMNDQPLPPCSASQFSTDISDDTHQSYSSVLDNANEEDPVLVIPVEVNEYDYTDDHCKGEDGTNFQCDKTDEDTGHSVDDSCSALFQCIDMSEDVGNASFPTSGDLTEHIRFSDKSSTQSKTNNINSIGVKLSQQKQQQVFENSEYDCHECHKKFTYKSSLRKHLLLHNRVNPHNCGICDQSFKSKTDLKIHSALHTGETPLQCSYCSKVFSQKHYLMVHERQHMGDNPHKCSECDKVFTSRANLEKHFRLHTGEKPYECPACSKRFTQKGNLRSHFVRIHKMLKLHEYNLEEI